MNPRTSLVAALALGVVLGLSTGCGRKPTGPARSNENQTTENKPGDAKPADGKPDDKNKPGPSPGPAPVPGLDNSFRVNAPDRVELKQGGSQTIEVSITRGAGFNSEVKFSLRSPGPREAMTITFTPADWQLNSNDNSQTVTARAAPNAPTGSFTWKLIVRPRVGKEVTQNVTVVVSP
jgi:hypothetical protein